MRILREWLHRLAGALLPGRRDADLEQELRLHLEMAAEEAQRRGVDPAAAARSARIEAGSALQAMEALRAQRGVPWLDDLARDVSHGLRTLRRTPMFTTVALVTLALGIGANAAIFSIVNGVLLRPLGYPKPEQLMYLTTQSPDVASTEGALSVQEYLEFRQINQSFAAVGAYRVMGGAYTTGEVNLMAGDRPLRVRSISVDAHLLNTLAVQPAQGRFFTEEETDRAGGVAPALAILSYELWHSVLGGQSLVGQTLNVDGRSHEILGVMPPRTDVMDNGTAIWLPLGLPAAIRQDRGYHILHVVGRLKDSVTAEAAQTELKGLLENWAERTDAAGHVPSNHPVRATDHSLHMQPMKDVLVGDASRSIWLLQVAVGLVLLIACANLASLLIARAESRRHEFAMRAALGASRSRLLRQTMTEGVMLCIAGGMIGLWLADIAVHALTRAYSTTVPRMREIGLDVPVLLFTLGVSVAVGVLFGLAPVATRRMHDLVTALKQGGDRGASGTRHHVRGALVVAEVALAVMLITGAGLLMRTVYNLTQVEAGFDRSRLVTFSLTLAEPYEPDTRALAYQRLLDELRVAPGVQGAAVMSGLPPNRSPEAIPTRIENHTASDGGPVEVIDYYQFVMGDYFGTMGVPLVAGRGFNQADAASSGRVAVVNETLANRIWKGQNPIGRRLRPNLSAAIGFGGNAWHTVIGVAKDVKQSGVEKATGTELYISLDQLAMAAPTMNVVLRTDLPPSALSQTLEHLLRKVDPAVPIVRLRDMESVFAESIRRPRLLAQLLGAFAGLALLLAALGTYGVLSYLATERRREIGIRVALGSTRSSVLALVMKLGLQLTLVGIVIGLAGAFALNRLVASLLFGVQPTDPITLGAVIITIVLVATGACWLPAWRASRLDPTVVLRRD
jgi:putative ABC transport system permease protein